MEASSGVIARQRCGIDAGTSTVMNAGRFRIGLPAKTVDGEPFRDCGPEHLEAWQTCCLVEIDDHDRISVWPELGEVLVNGVHFDGAGDDPTVIDERPGPDQESDPRSGLCGLDRATIAIGDASFRLERTNSLIGTRGPVIGARTTRSRTLTPDRLADREVLNFSVRTPGDDDFGRVTAGFGHGVRSNHPSTASPARNGAEPMTVDLANPLTVSGSARHRLNVLRWLIIGASSCHSPRHLRFDLSSAGPELRPLARLPHCRPIGAGDEQVALLIKVDTSAAPPAGVAVDASRCLRISSISVERGHGEETHRSFPEGGWSRSGTAPYDRWEVPGPRSMISASALWAELMVVDGDRHWSSAMRFRRTTVIGLAPDTAIRMANRVAAGFHSAAGLTPVGSGRGYDSFSSPGVAFDPTELATCTIDLSESMDEAVSSAYRWRIEPVSTTGAVARTGHRAEPAAGSPARRRTGDALAVLVALTILFLGVAAVAFDRLPPDVSLELSPRVAQPSEEPVGRLSSQVWTDPAPSEP